MITNVCLTDKAHNEDDTVYVETHEIKLKQT